MTWCIFSSRTESSTTQNTPTAKKQGPSVQTPWAFLCVVLRTDKTINEKKNVLAGCVNYVLVPHILTHVYVLVAQETSHSGLAMVNFTSVTDHKFLTI